MAGVLIFGFFFFQLVVSIIFEAFQYARLEAIGSVKDEEDRKTDLFLKGLKTYVAICVCLACVQFLYSMLSSELTFV